MKDCIKGNSIKNTGKEKYVFVWVKIPDLKYTTRIILATVESGQ